MGRKHPNGCFRICETSGLLSLGVAVKVVKVDPCDLMPKLDVWTEEFLQRRQSRRRLKDRKKRVQEAKTAGVGLSSRLFKSC